MPPPGRTARPDSSTSGRAAGSSPTLVLLRVNRAEIIQLAGRRATVCAPPLQPPGLTPASGRRDFRCLVLARPGADQCQEATVPLPPLELERILDKRRGRPFGRSADRDVRELCARPPLRWLRRDHPPGRGPIRDALRRGPDPHA